MAKFDGYVQYIGRGGNISEVSRTGNEVMAVGMNIPDVNRYVNNPSERLKVYVKGIIRDGKEHIFIQANDQTLVTYVREPDGTFSEHHDIPS